MEGIHSTNSQTCDALASDVLDESFFSLRFGPEHGVVPMANQLRDSLAARGGRARIINMSAGGDIDSEVFKGIEECGVFVVFGSAKYGEDTGNQACTCVFHNRSADLSADVAC
eukprot:COSAG03_NODE_677_length_6352_cov_24.786982_5_plen_113_part_00